MKKHLSFLLLVPFAFALSGCGEQYTLDKFSVAHSSSYYIYDNFDYSNLNVVYDGFTLEKQQYIVDFSNFSTNKEGTSSITVSLKKDTNIKRIIDIQTTKRTKANFLLIGSDLALDSILYANQISHSNEALTNINFSALTYDGSLNEMYASFAKQEEIYTYHYFNEEEQTLTSIENKSLSSVLLDENIVWDVICFEPDSILSCFEDEYKNLNSFISIINSYLEASGRKEASISFNIPWAYQDNANIDYKYYEFFDNSESKMYEAIISNTKTYVNSSKSYNFIIPSGVAIENVRNSELDFGEDLTTNGRNLNSKYGSYIVGLTLASKLSGYKSNEFTYLGVEANLISEEEKTLINTIVDSSINNLY